MYHNGWRGDHSETGSSPLVPNLYPPNMNHQMEQTHSVPGIQFVNHQQQQFLSPHHNSLNPHLLHHPPPFFQHHSAPQQHHPAPNPDLSTTLAQLAAGQQELFESLRNLSVRVDSANHRSVDQLAAGLENINLGRQPAPHLAVPQPHIPVQPSRVSSPSEGHCARDPNRLV